MTVRSIDDITIRPATNQDRGRVIALVSAVLEEHQLSLDPHGKDVDLNDIEGNYIEPGGIFELLEDQHGNLVGTVGLCRIDVSTCELRKMYFVPRIRGIGLGKYTLGRMIAKARELGFKKMQLETVGVLKTAVHLYRSAGFVPITTEHVSARCDQAFSLDLTK